MFRRKAPLPCCSRTPEVSREVVQLQGSALTLDNASVWKGPTMGRGAHDSYLSPRKAHRCLDATYGPLSS